MHDLWKVIISMAFDGCHAYARCMNEALRHWRELGFPTRLDKFEQPRLFEHPMDVETRSLRLKLLARAHQLALRLQDDSSAFRYASNGPTFNCLLPNLHQEEEDQRVEISGQYALARKEETQRAIRSATHLSLPSAFPVDSGVGLPHAQLTLSRPSASKAAKATNPSPNSSSGTHPYLSFAPSG